MTTAGSDAVTQADVTREAVADVAMKVYTLYFLVTAVILGLLLYAAIRKASKICCWGCMYGSRYTKDEKDDPRVPQTLFRAPSVLNTLQHHYDRSKSYRSSTKSQATSSYGYTDARDIEFGTSDRGSQGRTRVHRYIDGEDTLGRASSKYDTETLDRGGTLDRMGTSERGGTLIRAAAYLNGTDTLETAETSNSAGGGNIVSVGGDDNTGGNSTLGRGGNSTLGRGGNSTLGRGGNSTLGRDGNRTLGRDDSLVRAGILERGDILDSDMDSEAGDTGQHTHIVTIRDTNEHDGPSTYQDSTIGNRLSGNENGLSNYGSMTASRQSPSDEHTSHSPSSDIELQDLSTDPDYDTIGSGTRSSPISEDLSPFTTNDQAPLVSMDTTAIRGSNTSFVRSGRYKKNTSQSTSQPGTSTRSASAKSSKRVTIGKQS